MPPNDHQSSPDLCSPRARFAVAGFPVSLPEDRAAFVLRVVGEVPMDDAAAILDLPVWIVRLRTHRACLLVNAYLSYLAARAGIV